MTFENMLTPAAAKNLGICIKNKDQIVASQNGLCQEICGNQEGQQCSKLCSSLLSSMPMNAQGMHLHKEQVIDNDRVDVLIALVQDQILTLLYPLENQEVFLKKHEESLKSFGLTKSEISIVFMVLSGLTNAQIAEKLFVSRSTIKTHLNNIYRKLPASAVATRLRGRKVGS